MSRQGEGLRQIAMDTALREDLARMATAITRCRSVVFSGVGASLHAADVIASRFRSRGLAAWTINASDLVHHTRVLHGTPLVLISQSGGSIEIVKAAGTHATRSPTWCVTLNPETSLPSVMRVVVPGGEERGYAATRSFTSTLAVGEALLDLCATEDDGSDHGPAADLFSIADDIDRVVSDFARSMPSAIARLSHAGTLLFTARGALTGVAAYGALITMELARRPAFALESAMVRHGPLEAFGSELALVVLRQDDPVAPLVTSLAVLARDQGSPSVLVHVGGPVEELTGQAPDIVAPARSSFAALLVQCVAMQHMAIALTEARGLVPGEGTRGSKVTSVE